MLHLNEVIETNKMIHEMNLDVQRFIDLVFAKFGVMRVFFRFVGRFFEIKTLPLHKNNGDVLPSLWV